MADFRLRFGTVINCIDGRVQEPVTSWLKAQYQLDYVDVITEPGPDKLLAWEIGNVVLHLKNKAELSLRAHNSCIVALAGHHDCAGNPVSPEEHRRHIRKGIQVLRQWNLPVAIIGLWVTEEWRVQEISG